MPVLLVLTARLVMRVMVALGRLLHDQRAITAWEYAMIAAVVAIGIVGALTSLGNYLLHPFATVSSAINAA